MRVAVVGSKSIRREDIRDLGEFLPEKTTEIISGGIKSEIVAIAREYALSHGMKFTEYCPNRKKYKQNALHECYIEMINNAKFVVALRNGRSHETNFIDEKCRSMCVSLYIYTIIPMPYTVTVPDADT